MMTGDAEDPSGAAARLELQSRLLELLRQELETARQANEAKDRASVETWRRLRLHEMLLQESHREWGEERARLIADSQRERERVQVESQSERERLQREWADERARLVEESQKERERLQVESQSEQERLQVESQSEQERLQRAWAEERARLTGTLLHLQSTLSWRMTAPLRRLPWRGKTT